MKYQVFTLSTKEIKMLQHVPEHYIFTEREINRFAEGIMHGVTYAGKRNWAVIIAKTDGDICSIVTSKDVTDKHMNVFLREYVWANNLKANV